MDIPDISHQPSSTPGLSHSHLPTSPTVAAFFDLDRTIIATSSAHALGKELLSEGLITPFQALHLSLEKASHLVAGHSDTQMESARTWFGEMITGWDVAQVRSVATQALRTEITPTVYKEARDLIEQHVTAGHLIVIVSASAQDLVDIIARELGISHVIATQLEVVDGKYTGNIPFYCSGTKKEQSIKDFASLYDVDLAASYAYSDSITDLPMLSTVGHPVAINPDRALRSHAKERGWPIHSFKNPVPILDAPTTASIGIGSALTLTTLVGALWWRLGRNNSKA